MKNILYLLLILISTSVIAQEKSHNKWYYNYDSVLKKAKRNKKPILIYFSGSDWCAPCIRLKKDLFEGSSFSEISKDYNLLYVDIPQNQDIISESQYKHNKDVMNKLNPKKVFPTVLVLDKKGKVKDKLSGYSSIAEPTEYLKMLQKYN